jgi:hypothetical protein
MLTSLKVRGRNKYKHHNIHKQDHKQHKEKTSEDSDLAVAKYSVVTILEQHQRHVVARQKSALPLLDIVGIQEEVQGKHLENHQAIG